MQEVDRHLPHIADIWGKFFHFLPNWRRDDVMISYARTGGGIGAHVDNYDVFLLQGRGSRRWSIENAFVSSSEEKAREVPNVQTRLLRDFVPHQSWGACLLFGRAVYVSPCADMVAGDCLYLPPRVPHQGTALDDACITVSMGLRAPSHVSVCSAYLEHVCSSLLDEVAMYKDPDLALQSSSGSVSSSAIATMRDTLSTNVVTLATRVSALMCTLLYLAESRAARRRRVQDLAGQVPDHPSALASSVRAVLPSKLQRGRLGGGAAAALRAWRG